MVVLFSSFFLPFLHSYVTWVTFQILIIAQIGLSLKLAIDSRVFDQRGVVQDDYFRLFSSE